MDELISKLPPSAMVIFTVALAVLFFTQRMGFWQGVKTAPVKGESAAQVAAVIVDSSALNAATASVEALNMTLIEYNMLTRKSIEGKEDLKDELSRLREEIRLSRELNSIMRR